MAGASSEPDTDTQPHGWAGSISDFLNTSTSSLIECLENHYQSSLMMEVDESQRRAWVDQIRLLHREVKLLIESRPASSDWALILEYELPRERGRRPDVIMLAGPTVVVLEFKGESKTTRAAVDQLKAYTRDISSYHAASHDRKLSSILVLSKGDAAPTAFEGVLITYGQDLGSQLTNLVLPQGDQIDLRAWLEAPYAPLPSLVAAARRIFDHEPLPSIRRAQSAGIEQCISVLQRVTTDAKAKGGRHLALVTGVPGAGKTLVGLQFVYSVTNNEVDGKREAVLLSGNGPLVSVLQHALKSKIFVQPVHNFLKQYGGNTNRLPSEHIWVYDEAQRAWDAQQVMKKRGHEASEPEDLIRLGSRMSGWAAIVGLIGEGQEIYLGEESGLGQWDDAILRSNSDWTVHCPQKLASMFAGAASLVEDDSLDLTMSLRSHLAEEIPQWIAMVLEGRLGEAKALMVGILNQGFDAYITRDLEEAKAYATTRYAGQETKRFGLLASSKAQNLDKYNVRNEYAYTRMFREGPWYNDSPDSYNSCCQLREVATEFQCQGLELDFPLICWGDDLIWNDAWTSRPAPRSKAKNPHRLRVNSYRVLLSRGRDGFVVWVPPDSNLDQSYDALKRSGLMELTM